MKAKEFNEVFAIAQNAQYPYDNLVWVQQAQIALDGFGKKHCYATKAQAAYVLNYQARMFNLEYDAWLLEETRESFIKNVTLLD